MNKVAYLIAWRYLSRSAYEKNISTMIRISFISIVIGAFSLTLVTAIMNGFEKKIYEKMQGIHAPIMIEAYGKPINTDALKKVIKESFPEISAVSPSSTQHAIVQTDDTDAPTIALIQAIDPTGELLVSKLGDKIIMPRSATLPQLINGNQVIIGATLANDLGITIDDSIEILYTEIKKARSKTISFGAAQAVVSGIIKTGIDEYDSHLIICSFDFFDTIFPDAGTTQINVKLHDHALPYEKQIIKKLTERLKLEVYTWKDLYPALVSALILDKYVMFCILALITLVASMGIASLLFMQITQKAADIAILRAMGATKKTITHIFIILGMTITITASVVGIFFATCASKLLEKCPFIQLPDAYLVTHLPAKMEWHLVVTVFIVVIAISLVAVWIPSRKTNTITIADVLRFER